MKIIKGNLINFIPASHEDSLDPQVWKKILVSSPDIPIGQLQMVNWAKLPVGKQFQRHYHEDMYEVFVMVHGRGEMLINGKNYKLYSSDAAIVAPREIHSMKNTGSEIVEYVVFGIAIGKNGKTMIAK